MTTRRVEANSVVWVKQGSSRFWPCVARSLPDVAEDSLRRELHIGRSQTNNLDVLRQEVYTLQRELLQDRTKVKALSEELENPDNTHRWRKLQQLKGRMQEQLEQIAAQEQPGGSADANASLFAALVAAGRITVRDLDGDQLIDQLASTAMAGDPDVEVSQ